MDGLDTHHRAAPEGITEPSVALPSPMSLFALTSFTSPAEAMASVLRLLAEHLHMRSTFIAQIGREEQQFEIVAAFNLPGGSEIREGELLHLPDTFCATIAEAVERGPLIVPDARTHAYFSTLRTQPQFNIGSYLGVPIVLGNGTLFGTLCALDPADRSFTAHDVDLVAVLGRLLGSYIENAQIAEEREVQRRAAEQRTAEFAALLESVDTGVFLVAWPDKRVRFVNARMSELVGLDLRPSVGQEKEAWVTNHLMWHMAHPEQFAGRLNYLYAHPREVAVDEIEVARPVSRTLRRYSGPVYAEDKTLLGRIEVYSDITEAKRLETAKDEFLAIASHDLRTPVTAIAGYAQLLLRRITRGTITPERLTNSVERIVHQADELTDMMDRLLDTSRITAGSLEIRTEPSDAAELVASVVDDLAPTLSKHQVHLELPDEHPLVEWDRARIRQVLANLLTNAAKYSPEGTTIQVGLCKRRDGEHDAVEYWVRDQGAGIAPEDHEHIFERFSRTRAAGASDVAGTGLGLYIAKAIVEAHGGQITVESALGAGATFRIILPNRPRKAAVGSG